MCDLTIRIEDKEVIVYKIVAVNKRTGDYFSLAMGFRYIDKLIPKIRVQRVIGYFNNHLLDNIFYNKNMVGRTAIFTKKQDAKRLAGNPRLTYDGFNVSIKKAIVSIDLMKGNYEGMSVIAGRTIRFLD